MKSAQTVRIRFNKRGIKKSDRRHRGLLRARRERPRSRAAEQRNELTPPHVGHGASSPPATRGSVSSACHNAAGKSFGQGPEFRSVENPPRHTLRGKALWRLHCFLFPDCCRRGGASEKQAWRGCSRYQNSPRRPEPAHTGFRAPPSPAVGGAWYSLSTMILPHDERGIRWVRSILKVRRHPQYLECKALQFKA